jgi:hypothetical protein
MSFELFLPFLPPIEPLLLDESISAQRMIARKKVA